MTVDLARMTVDLVIFDCDGVIIDSEILSADILIGELAQLGVEIDLAFVYNHCLGRSFPTVSKRLTEHFSISLPQGFEQAYREKLLFSFEGNLRPMPEILSVLNQLNVPFCLATSSSPERVKRSLSIVNLSSAFAGRVFTASEVSRGKPAPDLFLHAAKTMQVSAQNCLVIEDSNVGIAAGQAAGMAVLRFVGGSHMRAVDPADRLDQGSGAAPGSYREFAKFEELFEIAPQLRKAG